MITIEEKYFGYDLSIDRHTPNNLTYPDHLHRSFEIVFIQSGCVEITIDSHTHSIRSGEMVLIFPFQVHSFATNEHSKISILIFPPEYIYDFYLQNKENIFSPQFIRPTIDDFLELYHYLFESSSLITIKYSFYKILTLFEQRTTLEISKKERSLTIQILNYIETNIAEPITIKSVSQAVGYSTSYVSKYLTKHIQLTFPKLVNKIRIRHSCYLLTNSSLSITDLSDQSGFQNVRTFNRNFSKEIGISPTEYRRAYMKY